MELLAGVTNLTRVDVRDGQIHTTTSLRYEILRGELNQLRIAVPTGHQIVCEGLELNEPDPAPVLKLHREAAGRAEPLDGGRRECEDDSLTDFAEQRTDPSHKTPERLVAPGSIVPVIQCHNRAACVDGGTRVKQGIAPHRNHVLDTGRGRGLPAVVLPE